MKKCPSVPPKQWDGSAQRHVYSCICCLKIKTWSELELNWNQCSSIPDRCGYSDAEHKWTIILFPAVDQPTILVWMPLENYTKYHHLVSCFWLHVFSLYDQLSLTILLELLLFSIFVIYVNLLFSLPHLFWTFDMRWEGKFLRVSMYKNTWCSTFWNLFFFNALTSSWALCGFVLCGPLAIRLSGCWPCK